MDYFSQVTFHIPGILLYTDGDNVTLNWNPNDIIPTRIASPNDYNVSIDLYYYYTKYNQWRKNIY